MLMLLDRTCHCSGRLSDTTGRPHAFRTYATAREAQRPAEHESRRLEPGAVQLLTSIRRGLTASRLGRCTVKTPFLSSAEIFSGSIASDTENER